MGIIAFYISISRYEERILAEVFGNDYLDYKKKSGMLFPKLRSHLVSDTISLTIIH